MLLILFRFLKKTSQPQTQKKLEGGRGFRETTFLWLTSPSWAGRYGAPSFNYNSGADYIMIEGHIDVPAGLIYYAGPMFQDNDIITIFPNKPANCDIRMLIIDQSQNTYYYLSLKIPGLKVNAGSILEIYQL